MLRLPSTKVALAAGAVLYNMPHLWAPQDTACQRMSYNGISRRVAMLRWVPTRFLSRAWGHIASFKFPWPLSLGLVNTYAKVTGCNMNEVEGSMNQFSSVTDFFTRKLKPNARPIDSADFISPVDGRVLHVSSTSDASSCWVEQVKGVSYRIDDFMGPRGNDDTFGPPTLAKGSKLCAITIYLSPRDYHRIHAPTDWSIKSSRHFPGQLLTVFPKAAKLLPGLFVANERVVLNGVAANGRKLAMGCVGAMNVGRIKLTFDPDMRTNKARARCNGRHYDRVYNGTDHHKGDEVGYFELGSTVVLVMEVHEGDVLHVKPGDKVKMGCPLMTMAKESTDTLSWKSWISNKVSRISIV